MSKALLEIRDLPVRAEEKEILHGVNLTVGQDETHVLMGLTALVNLRWATP